MKKIRSFLAFVLTVSVFTATACTSQTGESSSAADLQSVSQSQENSDSSSESEADSSQTAKPVTGLYDLRFQHGNIDRQQFLH